MFTQIYILRLTEEKIQIQLIEAVLHYKLIIYQESLVYRKDKARSPSYEDKRDFNHKDGFFSKFLYVYKTS